MVNGQGILMLSYKDRIGSAVAFAANRLGFWMVIAS